MSAPLQVRVSETDTRTKCSKCSGQIRAGQEFFIEPWPNKGGFDHYHYECPPLADNTGPRVVQQPRRNP